MGLGVRFRLTEPHRRPIATHATDADGDGDGEDDGGGFSISAAAPVSTDMARRRRRPRRKAVVDEEGEAGETAEGEAGEEAEGEAEAEAEAEAALAAAAVADEEAAASAQAQAAAAAARRRRKAEVRAEAAARQAASAAAALPEDGFSVSASAPGVVEEAEGAEAAATNTPAPQPLAASNAPRSRAPAPPSKKAPLWSKADATATASALNEVGAGRGWRYGVKRTVQRWGDMSWADRWTHAREAAYKRVVWEWEAPNTGTMHLSYARLLDLLASRGVARLTVLGKGRVALAEVPVEGYANDLTAPPSYDRFDADVMFSPGGTRDSLEVNRFYVDLPGDVWARGTLMRLARDAAVPVLDSAGRPTPAHARQYDRTTADVAVLEPLPRSEVVSIIDTKGSAALWLLAARAAALGASWVGGRLTPPDDPEDETEALLRQLSAHTAIEYNTAGPGGKRDTGVRYADVAGVEPVMATIREYVELITGSARFQHMGARPPRGLIFEGPPGTGKTLLAKAMAGEAGLPFFACNGAEFVEMYEGVAAARVRDLFTVARAVAPSIIFIDEIDALGRDRDASGPSDPGAQEREQALLALLVEMDGFVRDDPVLCIGATNLSDSLDPALVRPGRFDRTLHLGLPSEPNRLKILGVHAAGKPLDRSGGDALLARAAAKTIGWSGAELANLMNEAAIFMVRRGSDAIGWPELADAIHKRGRTAGATDGPEALAAAVADEVEAEAVAAGPDVGGGDAPGREAGAAAAAARPASVRPAAVAAARRRLATILAARAVGAALTAGLPRIEAASMHSRVPGAVAALRFQSTELTADGAAWARLGAPSPAPLPLSGGRRWPNATPDLVAEAAAAAGVDADAYVPSAFEVVAGLAVCLYVPRAAEVELFGPGAASGATLGGASTAASLAEWLAGNSMLHPRRRTVPVPTGDSNSWGDEDALTGGAFGPGDAAAAAALRDAAWARARSLVRERAGAIRAVAAVLMGDPGAAPPSLSTDSDSDGDEDGRIAPGTVSGARVVALIAEHAAAAAAAQAAAGGAVAAAASPPDSPLPPSVGPPAWLAAARAAAARRPGLAPGDGEAALESVAGSLALQDLIGMDAGAVERALEASITAPPAVVAREAAVRRFALTPGGEGELPPPPAEMPVDKGPALAGWGPEGLQTPSLKRKG